MILDFFEYFVLYTTCDLLSNKYQFFGKTIGVDEQLLFLYQQLFKQSCFYIEGLTYAY